MNTTPLFFLFFHLGERIKEIMGLNLGPPDLYMISYNCTVLHANFPMQLVRDFWVKFDVNTFDMTN